MQIFVFLFNLLFSFGFFFLYSIEISADVANEVGLRTWFASIYFFLWGGWEFWLQISWSMLTLNMGQDI